MSKELPPIVKLGQTEVFSATDEFGKFFITKFEDGRFVLARPIDEPWDSVVQHEWTHTYLAWCLFQEPSYVMWTLAHPNEPKNMRQFLREEAAVLRICEFLSTA